ncbi:MAG TPA: molecular chaperone HtpG, partial [Chromatiales bacterium]|nr:molecular chaperone HtpG [Chromatiales bacterium]
KKGVEVLLLSERVDEWLVSHLTEFDGKPLQSVAKGGLDLNALEDQEERRSAEQAETDYRDLLARMREALGERVREVRVSQRLITSPSCLVLDEHDVSVHLQRVLKAAGQEVPAGKPILEINPDHPLVRRLKGESDGARFTDWALILFDQALLADGGQLEDPAAFVGRLNDLLLRLSLE